MLILDPIVVLVRRGVVSDFLHSFRKKQCAIQTPYAQKPAPIGAKDKNRVYATANLSAIANDVFPEALPQLNINIFSQPTALDVFGEFDIYNAPAL